METTENNESTNNMSTVSELTNQLLDTPKMISNKLPWKNWTSRIEDSENRIAGWFGKIFKIGALVICLGILWYILKFLWINDGNFWGSESTILIGGLVSILLWACAAFPIAMIVRNTGDSLGSSKSNIVNLIFLDLPVALIKLSGYILAMIGLFAAASALLSFITTLPIVDILGQQFSGLAEMGSMGTVILFEILAKAGLSEFAAIMSEMMNPNLGMTAGEPWTVSGAMGVFGSFISILVILVNLYINVVVYKFLFGLVSTLVKWVKAPYFPYKAL